MKFICHTVFVFLILSSLTTYSQTAVCPGENFQFTSNINGSQYQWKLAVDTGFANLSDGTNFAGTTTAQLKISNAPSTWAGYEFRCFVDGHYSEAFTIKFTNEWKGTVSQAWEEPQNWGCGTVPDQYTDVVVKTAQILLVNSDAFCRSIVISPQAQVKVNTGFSLNITKPGAPVDQLSSQQIAILDSLPEIHVPLDDILLEDGQSVGDFLREYDLPGLRKGPKQNGIPLPNTKENQKKSLLAKMIQWGDYLVTDANFVHTDVTEPKTGLNYMPGGKQYEAAMHPLVGDCTEMLYYGLDCSGMIYVMTTKSDLPAVVAKENFSVANITDTAKWNEAFRKTKDMAVKYDSIYMDPIPMSRMPVDSFKSGDLILWDGHVGIVLNNNAIYQSNGAFKETCENNRLESRGPHTIPLNKSWLSAFGKYQVFRITYLKVRVFDTSNTAAFKGNSNLFKSLAVGKGGAVYAGTVNEGLYKFTGGVWEKMSILTNNNITDMQTDQFKGVWIAQIGRSGIQALTGGINWLPNNSLDGFEYISATRGLPTRYCRSVFVDTTRTTSNTAGPTPRVWTANMPQLTSGELKSGAIGLGVSTDNFNQAFKTISDGVDVASDDGSIPLIAGNSAEVWAYAERNIDEKNQLLIYDAGSSAFKSSIDLDAAWGTPRALLFDATGKKWMGTNGGKVIVYTGTTPTVVDLSTFVGGPVSINTNAMAAGTDGKIYIGTTQGLYLYKGGAVTDINSYVPITAEEGLPSNNVLDVVESPDGTLIVATDAGIAFIYKKYK